MKKLLYIILLAGFTITCGCKQQEATVPPSGKVVKVGVITPLSGPDKKSGENALLGIKTALQLQPFLNNGDKIELVIEDNQGTPEQTAKALAKLSRNDDLSGVLLMAESDIVLEVAPVADQYKTPILALVATHPHITENNKYISQLGFDDIFQGTVAALFVMDELLIDRVAVISDPENSHYSFLAAEFIRKYESLGGKLVEHVTVDHSTGEYQKILEQLRRKKTQLLYLAVKPERILQISRSAGKIDWNPKMMGSDGLLASIILQNKGEIGLVNGMMATDFYSTVLPKTEYGKKVVKIYGKHFSEPGTTYTGLGCEGVSILLNAMDRCDNKSNKTCVNYMLRNTEGFEGLFGKITIREDGKAERPIFVNVIDDQELKFLIKVY